ncbi:MAG: shikimate kinase [Pseudomonadota bacterium]
MKNRRRSAAQKILDELDGRSIVLLGMMGCGKSAIGKMLARKLGLEFKDADAEIEEAAGRSVAEIFEEFGEDEFRRLETRVIDRVLNEGPVLLALGGGAFMSEETRKTVAEKGLSVWIRADIELLLERVGRRPGKRPLLRTGNPREILANLLLKREPVYALADIHVHSKGGTKAEMRDRVMAAIQSRFSDVKEDIATR